MKEQNRWLYLQEHFTCKHYAADGPVVQLRVLEAGEYIHHESDQRSVLCFVLEGALGFCPAERKEHGAKAGELFFVPQGETCWGRAREASVVILCFLDASIALCNTYTLKNLVDFMPKEMSDDEVPVVLPIRDLLMAELAVTRTALTTGLFCYHYQRDKRDIFLLMLRGFYTKEELARLFAPALSRDYEFKQTVLGAYSPAINVQELIHRSGMPPTSFNRKFVEVFGTTPRRWLIDRKKGNILCDLLMTELSTKELAQKYGLSANYFNVFCQQHLGGAPLDIRKNGAAHRNEV